MWDEITYLFLNFYAPRSHYSDIKMGAMTSKITSLTIVCSPVYAGADQRKHQSSASLAFVRGIHRWQVNSPHKWPVTRKMFPSDDVIMMKQGLSRVYTPCARMRRQPAQMSRLAAACASPLHSASCAVDKSINRRAYASVYVRIRPYQNNASALGDLGALSWLAGMPALVCAGLESSTSLNFVGDSRRMRAYALGATGDRSINSCVDSRCMRAYTRVYARIRAHGV